MICSRIVGRSSGYNATKLFAYAWLLRLVPLLFSPMSYASSAFPGRLGEAIDVDKNEIINRGCVIIDPEDIEFIAPNWGVVNLGYDYTANELKKKFGVEASSAFSVGGLSIEGDFRLHLRAAKTNFSSTVVVYRLARGGELRLKSGAVVSLSELGRAAQESPDEKVRRDLCGQGYIRSINLSSGLVGVIKIDYRSRASYLELGATLQLDMPSISVGGEFEVILNKLKKHGDVSLHLFAWGGAIHSLGQSIQSSNLQCSVEPQEDIYSSASGVEPDSDTQQDQMAHCLLTCQTTGNAKDCARVMDALVEYSGSFFDDEYEDVSPETVASRFYPAAYQIAPYDGNVVDHNNNHVSLFRIGRLDDIERMNVSVIGEQIELELAESLALAKRALDLLLSHYYLSPPHKTKLIQIIHAADEIRSLAREAQKVCSNLVDSDEPCVQKEAELAEYRDQTLDSLELTALNPPPLGFETWCQNLINAHLAQDNLDESEQGSQGSFINPYQQTTIAALIDEYDLTQTGEKIEDILSRSEASDPEDENPGHEHPEGTRIEDLNCRSIADRAISLVEITLTNKNIIDLSPLFGLNQIKRLNLSDNQSDLMSEDLAYLLYLRELDLSNTRTKQVEPVNRLTFLEKLNISDTDVVTLKALSGHSTIEEIDASFSKLRRLSLADVTWLRLIDLRGTSPQDILTFLADDTLVSLEEVILSETIAIEKGLACNSNFNEHIYITCVKE